MKQAVVCLLCATVVAACNQGSVPAAMVTPPSATTPVAARLVASGADGNCAVSEGPAKAVLEALKGSWKVSSYVQANETNRYKTDGIMSFADGRFTQIVVFDPETAASPEYTEVHAGRYCATGAVSGTLTIEQHLHWDPARRMQQETVRHYQSERPLNITLKFDDSRRRLTVKLADIMTGGEFTLERLP